MKKKFFLTIYLLTLAVLGELRGLFLWLWNRGLLLVPVHGRLIVVASPVVVDHELAGMWVSVVAAPRLSGTGSVVVHVVQGLSCSTACGILPIKDLYHVSCIGRQILYH